MIDTHAHLYDSAFDEDREKLIVRAREKGVSRIILPNVDTHSMRAMVDLSRRYPQTCYAAMGLHPCYVKDDYAEQLIAVKAWIQQWEFVAVGEIGTDLHWGNTYWDAQVEAFQAQCELARQHHLPVIIHCRDSLDETLELVSGYAARGLQGVFHCFTGSPAQASAITELGFYLGIGGVSTFKNGGMEQVIPQLDRERILLETDAPYLAPVPMRGKRNEPAFLPHICRKVSELLGLPFEAVAQLTTRNALRLFFPNEALDEL